MSNHAMVSASQSGIQQKKEKKSSVVFLLPVLVFAGLAIAFAIGLKLNPKEIPSVLIGKTAPDFNLPPVEGRKLGLSDEDLMGKVSLVNVFASWCTECKVEHPFLMELSKKGILPIHGLNYKDKPADARNWLDGLGDPYTRTGADRDGRVAIDWGVYGVPETFLIDQKGRIVFKHIGALNWQKFNDNFLPIIKDLQGNTRS